MTDLVLATRNRGKKGEFAQLLAGLPIRLRSLDEFPDAPDPEENGTTFRENALIKARSAMQATGCWALADDSGLCVDALGGAPGIYSARYAEGTDETRWQKLLRELKDEKRRTAAFVCILALVSPAGVETTTEGSCPGRIALAPKGESGFGYDPVFLIEGDPKGRTMAELPDGEKNAISHRGRAFIELRPHLALVR